MATHSTFLPGKALGHRTLGGYSPWDCKELDTTEQLTHTHTHTHTHGGRGGREVQEGGYICIHTPDSFRCTAETNTTL